jgi:hypothetical protein
MINQPVGYWDVVFLLIRSCSCEVFCVGEAKWAELGGGFIGVSTALEMTNLDMGWRLLLLFVALQWVA